MNCGTWGGGRIWRPAAIQRIVENPIYKGEFVWNGSSYSRYEAKKTGRKLEPLSYARPDLRLVPDELWERAQPKRITRTGYGGGRNQFSGLIVCSCCGSVLTSSSKGRAMACGTCCANRRSGDPDAPSVVPTVGVGGLSILVAFALQHVFDEARLEQIRTHLRERLAGGPQAELARLRRTRDKAEHEAKQLVRMIRNADGPDAVLEAEYKEAKGALVTAERQLREYEESHASWRGDDIVAQLKVEPHMLAAQLLDGTLEASEVRSVLAQLFPRFVFLGRSSRQVSHFSVEFAPGAAVAWLSGTTPQFHQRVRMQLRLESSARRPVTWKIGCESIDTIHEADCTSAKVA